MSNWICTPLVQNKTYFHSLRRSPGDDSLYTLHCCAQRFPLELSFL